MRWVGTLDIQRRATTNKAIRQHWSERADVLGSIRDDMAWLAQEAGNRAPRFNGPVTIEIHHEYRRAGQAKLPDTDAIALAAKSVLDGLVLARVLVDDDGDHVQWVRLHRPTWSGDGRDAITIEVESDD